MANLKIKSEHFNALKTAIEETLKANPEAESKYKSAGLPAKRFRWDIMYASSVAGISGNSWVCCNLYSYMNDDNIDSALRAIIPPYSL